MPMKKKPLPCPKCGSRLMDADECVQTQARVFDPYDQGPPRDRWRPDYYIKCRKCGTKIAFRKLDIQKQPILSTEHDAALLFGVASNNDVRA